jgi:diguanylate cyclase (GGDEF)-like protein
VRVANRGRVLGYLGLETLTAPAPWREEHRDLLRVLANLAGDAMTQVDAEREIQRIAFFDAVTALPNRTLFATRLDEAIERARAGGKHIGVALIDLDGFKSVNDTVGHAGGDDLLRQVAARIASRVRKGDTVSRFGGDEFLLMVPQLGRPEDMRSVADHLMNAFRDPVTIHGQEFFVTASAGVAIYPDDGEDAATLVKNADLAMYAAKALGKNRFATCTPAMKGDVEQRMRLIHALYRAQERGEFVLHYQPQVSLASRRIVGVEALLRWHHPDLGAVPPSTFVPLLEQTGLIGSVGAWALRTACSQGVAWRAQGHPPVRIAVNLSVQQVRNPGIVDVVQRALVESGLPPRYLELEITESTAIKESGDILATLDALKALGVTISIDDFGTEYSSLERLAQMPIDRVKMAMPFVHGIGEDSRQEAIVNVIIDLARNLGLMVMAEGVETDAQLAYLEGRRCDDAQGYRFFKPMSAEEIGRRMALVA